MPRAGATRCFPVRLLSLVALVVLSVAPVSGRTQERLVLNDEAGTYQVGPGDRLEVRNFAGSVRITTWGRDKVHVEADRPGLRPIVIERRGRELRVVPEAWERDSGDFDVQLPEMARIRVEGTNPAAVAFDIKVPAWLPVTVESPYSNVEVTGSKSSLDIMVFDGSVRVSGVRGRISVVAMAGEIVTDDSSGRLTLGGTVQPIRVRGCVGDVRAETTSGDIHIESGFEGAVEATTVDGDVRFAGKLGAGTYDLSSHSGNVELHLSSDLDAAVTARAFRGRFRTDLDVDVPDSGRVSFTAGSGAASVRLSSFTGDIGIHRR